MSKTLSIALCCLLLGIPLTACSHENQRTESNLINHKQKKITLLEKSSPLNKGTESKGKPVEQIGNSNKTTTEEKKTEPLNSQTGTSLNMEGIQVVAKPDSIPVLVNKKNMLPDSYTPEDLIYTNIPFIISERLERRKMRREAAVAIEKLFTGASVQGIHLLGVSAYRSHSAQVALFNFYAKRDGYEKARTYSALAGTSEHETGLAIDVTGGNGQCPAEDCFGFTTEAKWLQKHAADFGFIIRYPKGKEAITGYKYEPWHLRYVGSAIAKEVMDREITLEEYYHTLPVNQ
ncbi:D-alanyl-D-alanine carboxypeptidase family protein [Bacillus sp. EB600]|uniref:M15 family metallopeptidase n=1 Tax=Bacillus sp. EB600 TaxID=2806345 RepID=UPI00210A362A|nr:M15 family metallopeptidase [Bacillus sp. EB600]MCQ6280377.1 M15 family metallopeptidase [Bacillus sp. EB600]